MLMASQLETWQVSIPALFLCCVCVLACPVHVHVYARACPCVHICVSAHIGMAILKHVARKEKLAG